MQATAKLEILLDTDCTASAATAWRALPELQSESVAWIVADRSELEEARGALLGCSQARLAPAIRTLAQAADAILAPIPQAARTLTEIQRKRLVSQLYETAVGAGRAKHFGPAIGNSAGLPRLQASQQVVEQLCRAFAEIGAHAHRNGDGWAQWAAPGDAPAERELASLYHDYQTELKRCGLLDREGKLAEATQSLGNNRSGMLEQHDALLVTGVRSLPPVERRLLVALGRNVGRMIIVLPWDKDAGMPERSELDPEAIRCLPASPWRAAKLLMASLVREFSEVAIHPLAPTKPQPEIAASNSMPDRQRARLQAWLFRDPREAPPADAASESFSLLAARSTQEEVEVVAAQAKQLLREGVAAAEIVVAVPDVRAAAGRCELAFAAAGVPLSVARRRPLGESPLFRTLLQLVQLVTGDWQRDTLLGLVTSPALTRLDKLGPKLSELRPAGFANPRAAAEWTLREWMIAAGRDAWLERTPTTQERSLPMFDAQDGLSPQRQRRGLAAQAAANMLELLDSATNGWRRRATPLTWFDRIRSTLRRLGYQSSEQSAAAARDQAALPALESSLADLERLARWQSRGAPRLGVDELEARLQEWRRQVMLDEPATDEGRIRLVSMEAARLLRPEHLFLVGMSEQAVPAAAPASAVSTFGTSREDHLSNEMLKFYELSMSAQRRVTFSYAGLDAKAQPLKPSSYVAEVQRLLGLEPSPQLITHDQPVTAAADRQRSALALNDGNPGPLAGSLRLAPMLRAGLTVSLLRASGDGFGVAEGVFSDPTIVQQLASHYHADYQWSPTQLETYGQCPFKFLARHVLRVEPLADFDLKVDYRRRGSLLHDAMLRLHSRLKESGQVLATLNAWGDETFLAEFSSAIQSALAAVPPGSIDAALSAIEARQADGWGKGYHGQLLKYLDSEEALEGILQPTYFEASFGKPRAEELADEEPPVTLSRVDPYPLEANGKRILLTGRIDRIDVGKKSGQTVFNVVDYKAAKKVSANLDDLLNGRQLQLFLYTLATQHHLLAEEQAQPWRLGYWEVQNGGFKGPKKNNKNIKPAAEDERGQVAPTAEWIEYDQTVRRRIFAIVEGIRRGEFPMFNSDDKCGSRCEFSTACRVGHTRSLAKQPPGESDHEQENSSDKGSSE